MSNLLTDAVRAGVVYGLGAVMIACTLAAYARGRDLLRRVCRMVRRSPIDAAGVAIALYACVLWGGSKPTPPPVVTDRGIVLTQCVQTPRRVYFEWRAEDSRIRPGDVYQVQEWVPDFGWHTIATTSANRYEHHKFTIERMRKYRIAVDITGRDEEADR